LSDVIVAECMFDPPLTNADFSALNAKLDPCLRVRFVKLVSSYLREDGARAVLVFEAGDCESVRNAFRSAGTKFDTVWRATST
jgi:hypothetical protein